MQPSEARAEPTGIDASRVERWLTQHVEVTPPLQFELIAGGASNLTFRVIDAGGSTWAIRRPPLGNLLPSAHDMGREYQIIAALQDGDVPVPIVVGLCTDASVTGAPFYVTEFVDGVVVRTIEDAEQCLARDARHRVGKRVIDTLLALHAVDPDAVGLGQLGRREAYLGRQLRRWHRQLRSDGTRPSPVLDEVHRRLAADVPTQQADAIVHGDYRLDNLILGPLGDIRAVVDWELCTLGDPLADLGLLAVYWSQVDDTVVRVPWAASQAPGFPRREELISRYAAGSGLDLERLPYYVAFAYFKLAAILEGVYARYRSGAYGHVGQDWENYGRLAIDLADEALRATEQLNTAVDES